MFLQEIDHSRDELGDRLDFSASVDVTSYTDFAPINDDDVVVAMLEISCILKRDER